MSSKSARTISRFAATPSARRLAWLLSFVLLLLPLLTSGGMPPGNPPTPADSTMPCHGAPDAGADTLAGDCCDGFCADCAFCVLSVAVPGSHLPHVARVPVPDWFSARISRPVAGYPEIPYRPPAAPRS